MHVYFRLAQLRSKPLLPTLSHLRCCNISQDDFLISSICLFLTPTLKVIDFDRITSVEDKLIGTFMHTLWCDGARVERVRFGGEGLSRDTLSYLGCGSTGAGAGTWLRSVDVGGMGVSMDLGFVRALGRISGLEELKLNLEGSGLMSVASDEGDVEGESFGFGALLDVELVATISFVQSFLARITTTQLRHIGFESNSAIEEEAEDHPEDNNGKDSDRKEALECIMNRWKDTLTYFKMAYNLDDDEHDNLHHRNAGAGGGGGAGAAAPDDNDSWTFPIEITMKTLSPLLKVPHLRHLEVDGVVLELMDSDVAEMAHAWPEIQTLHLPFMLMGTVRPSVVSLQTLSKSCPELRNLVIPLDTTTTTTTAIVMGPGMTTRKHRLETLTIASPDEPWELFRVVNMARVVDQLFPFLDSVQASEEGEGEGGGRWSQVDHLVKMCQSVRTDAILAVSDLLERYRNTQ